MTRKTPRSAAATRQQAERLRGRPAHLVAVDDRVDGEHQRRGHGDGAARRRAACPGARPAAARKHEQREDDDRDADRDVDEEDPVPAERVREDPAEEHADRAAAGGDEAEDAHRLRALGGLGEERHDQRERDRGDDRASDALHRPRADERRLRAREAARERRGGEERDPGEEQPPVAEQVAEPAAEQQEAAERQQVGVHDPGERRLREAEVLADRRQRDADDRHVEHDHQVAEADDQKCEPAGAGVQGGHARVLSRSSVSGAQTADDRESHRSTRRGPARLRQPTGEDAPRRRAAARS